MEVARILVSNVEFAETMLNVELRIVKQFVRVLLDLLVTPKFNVWSQELSLVIVILVELTVSVPILQQVLNVNVRQDASVILFEDALAKTNLTRRAHALHTNAELTRYASWKEMEVHLANVHHYTLTETLT